MTKEFKYYLIFGILFFVIGIGSIIFSSSDSSKILAYANLLFGILFTTTAIFKRKK